MEGLESLHGSWKKVGLSVFQASALTSDVEILQQNQEKVKTTKKELMEQTKIVAGMEAGERKNAERAKLERGYQQFISELSKFFKHASDAFHKCVDLVQGMQDPVPALDAFVRNKNQFMSNLASAKKLRRDLIAREDELRELQNQEIVIRELREEVEDLQQVIAEHEEAFRQKEDGETGVSSSEKSGDEPTASTFAENAVSATAELRRQLQQQDYELQMLRTECRKYQVKSDTLSTEMENLRAQLEQEIVQRDEESAVSQRDAQELLVRVALAEHQMSRHTEQLSAVKEELQAMERQHEALQVENTELNLERSVLQQKLNDLQHQIQHLQTQHKAPAFGSSTMPVATTAADVFSQGASAAAVDESLRTQLAALESRETLLKDRLQTVTLEKEGVERENARLTQRLCMLEESESKLQRQTLQMQKEVAALEKDTFRKVSTVERQVCGTTNAVQSATPFDLAAVITGPKSHNVGSSAGEGGKNLLHEHLGGEAEQPEHSEHLSDMPGEMVTIIAQRNRYKERVEAVMRASEHEINRLEKEIVRLRAAPLPSQHEEQHAFIGGHVTMMPASEHTASLHHQISHHQTRHRKEASRGREGAASLSIAIDRLTLGVFRFVANNKTARFVFSGYLLALHVWVFIIFSWMAARSAYADGRVAASKKRLGLYYSVKNDDY